MLCLKCHLYLFSVVLLIRNNVKHKKMKMFLYVFLVHVLPEMSFITGLALVYTYKEIIILRYTDVHKLL